MFPLLTRRLFLALIASSVSAGIDKGIPPVACPSCKGKGVLEYEDGRVTLRCHPCKGTGSVILNKCKSCGKMVPLYELDTPGKVCWNCDIVIP